MPSPAPQDAPIQTDPPPKTWLVESILATILCCLPFGIVGLIYAAKVESLWSQGRRAEALDASRSAKIWTLVAVIIAVIFWVIYGSLIALGIVAGINGW
jgi:hypothetical protein